MDKRTILRPPFLHRVYEYTYYFLCSRLALICRENATNIFWLPLKKQCHFKVLLKQIPQSLSMCLGGNYSDHIILSTVVHVPAKNVFIFSSSSLQ